MSTLKQCRNAVLVITTIIFSVGGLTQCIDKNNKVTGAITKTDTLAFAGSASCMACHKDIYQQSIHSAHYLTSAPASSQTIKGHFENGANEVAFPDNTLIRMEATDSNFYQTEFVGGLKKRQERFDMA